MMAVTSTDDQVPTPGDDTCAFKQEDSEEPCPGHKADGFDHCLAHLEPAQLDQVLRAISARAAGRIKPIHATFVTGWLAVDAFPVDFTLQVQVAADGRKSATAEGITP